MTRRTGEGPQDLGPGIAAAGAFLCMFWLLGVPWLWLSALLSVGVYLGVKWLLPGRAPTVEEATATPDAESLLRVVGDFAPRLPHAALQGRLYDLCRTAEMLLRYCQEHPMRASDSRFVVAQYLEVTRTGVERFLETARFTGGSEAARQRLEALLDGVATRFQGLYENLVKEDDAALAGELDVLNRTLKDLDEVVLQLREDKG